MRRAIVFILLTVVLAGCSNNTYKQSEINTFGAASATDIQEQLSTERGCSSDPTDEEKYQQAIALIKEKHYPRAIGILRRLDDYKDSKSLLQQLRYLINGLYICNGTWTAAAITSEGKVQIAYSGENINEYSRSKDWENVISLSNGGDSVEGLTQEGKILTTSTKTKEDFLNSDNAPTNAMANVVESVSIWKDVIAFDASYPQTAICLTADGCVYAAYPGYENSTEKLNGWNDIVDVKDGRSYAVGLKSDGTVVSMNFSYTGNLDTSEWTDIVAISADSAVIGLKEDGTVVSTGLNDRGQGNVSAWKDIIAISTSRFCTLGLKSDGTVVAAGHNPYGQMDVQGWKDIIAIDAGEYFSIGLRADGTMVIAGDCSYSGVKTPDVTIMQSLYVPKINIEK